MRPSRISSQSMYKPSVGKTIVETEGLDAQFVVGARFFVFERKQHTRSQHG